MQWAILCVSARLFKRHLVVITDLIWFITIEHNITSVPFYNLSSNYSAHKDWLLCRKAPWLPADKKILNRWAALCFIEKLVAPQLLYASKQWLQISSDRIPLTTPPPSMCIGEASGNPPSRHPLVSELAVLSLAFRPAPSWSFETIRNHTVFGGVGTILEVQDHLQLRPAPTEQY